MAPLPDSPGGGPAPVPAAPLAPGFTWTRLFGEALQDQRGTVPTDEALRGKTVAVYFSAHWCGPCRGFTPRLKATYAKLKKDGVPFEVVYVSMDRNPTQFEEYFGSMPWLAVPFRDDQLRSVLSRKFSVMGIPQLVMLAPDSTVLSANARSAVEADPNGEAFPWPGAKEPRSTSPLPWMLLAFLVFWLLNNFLFPPSGRKS